MYLLSQKDKLSVVNPCCTIPLDHTPSVVVKILYMFFFTIQPGSLLTPMGGASPSQAGASSPSVLDSSSGMSPSQQSLPLGCPNSVLRIIIENMIYPITLDVLNQVAVQICTGMQNVKNKSFGGHINFTAVCK